jgi:hypothetical protein
MPFHRKRRILSNHINRLTGVDTIDLIESITISHDRRWTRLL